MPVNSTRAEEYVVDCIEAGLVPFLKGSPGIGKSALIKAVAEKFNLKVIDQRLSQCDPTDMNGFPAIVAGRATYVPFEMFPVEGTPLPLKEEFRLDKKDEYEAVLAGSDEKAILAFQSKYCHDGWLLFLDEFNSAPLAVQASAYKLILDKEIGQQKLHTNVAMACAGNLESDKAIVNSISTAMQSRVIHIPMCSDWEVWNVWAVKSGINQKIRDYVRFKGDEALNNFNPESTDSTFGCERTWEFASHLLDVWGGSIPPEKLQLLQGTIGEGLAQQFNSYIQVYKEIPDYAAIIGNPKGTTVPVEPDRRYAITGVLAQGADAATIAQAMQYILRLPLEFQVITLQDIISKDGGLANDPAVNQWVQANMNSLF